jgi:metallophosphoesterase (TIGR00282 family)
MRVLFLGDVVGRSGRLAVIEALPALIRELKLDFTVVNGENAAGGYGISMEIAAEFFRAGVDVVTTGNHAFDQRELLNDIAHEPRLLRPVNYPAQTPGHGSGLYSARDGSKVFVVNVMGRLFMDALDDPFRTVDAELERVPLGLGADFILVDMHAEASSEKMAMGHFCDGRASLVIGTHTHIPSADHQILPGGTAYQSDAGACADYDSVIGMEKSVALQRFVTRLPTARLQPSGGEATLCGVVVETDGRGLARSVEPLRVGGRLSQTLPKSI